MISGANEEQLELANARADILLLQQENQELKKQLEEERKKVSEYSYKLSNFRCEETYETQQKEFIEYLEKEIEALEFCDNEFILSNHKKEVKTYKEILLKYKEIIDTNINVDERGDDKKWKQEHIK